MQRAPADAADRPPALRRVAPAAPPAASQRPAPAPAASSLVVALVAAIQREADDPPAGLAADLLDRLSRGARTAGTGVAVLDRDDIAGELVLALRARPRETSSALLRRAQQAASQLMRVAPESVRVAVGGVAEADRAAGSVEQARRALELATRVAGLTDPLCFDDLGLYAFLDRALAACPEEGRTFARQVLGPLRAYDAATGSALLRTLRAYFANDTSIDRTATELVLHRHTVRYRLGRIAELTRRDPSTTRGREELNLALLIEQLLPA